MNKVLRFILSALAVCLMCANSYGQSETVIPRADFEEINSHIDDVDTKYKNPRNLCSGSVRQLNNQITAERNVRFYAFSLVRAEGIDFENSREKQFEFLKKQENIII